MGTEVRLRELCAINNNIVAECNKMIQYLQIIREKSNDTITYLNSLNTANILRRYSSTYEYLNKFYIKLLDQNCIFELFFMELDEPIVKDCSNKNLSETNFDLRKQSIVSDKEIPTTTFNEIKTCEATSKITKAESVPSDLESKSDSSENMNVFAKEFIPAKISTSLKNVSAENKPVSAKNDKCSTSKIAASFSKTLPNNPTSKIDKISKENDNLEAKIKPNIKTKKKEEQIKPDSIKKEENDIYVIDVKQILKQVNEKVKKNEVIVPDLRPVIVRKNGEEVQSCSTDVVSSGSSDVVPQNKTEISTKNVKKPVEKLKVQKIESNRGCLPKEGESCFVSSVESPSSFYIHIIRDENTLLDIVSQQISELSTSLRSFSNKIEAKKYINKCCVCYITTYSSWCRVEVKNWMMENENMLEVRLIDYGLTCKVPLRNIREANQYLFELPVMADKCQLAWVKPTNGREEWTTDSIEHFENLVNKYNRLFTISYISDDSGTLTVDLQNNEISSVAGLMISHGKADNADDSDDSNNKWSNEFMNKQITKSQGFTEEELRLAEEDRLEALMNENDEDDDEYDDPNLAVSHYKPKDETEICRFFLTKGFCYKGDSCQYSHTPLNPDGWTTDREPVYYESFNQLRIPPPGSEILVKIVSIVDLKTFYVVIKNLPDCIELFGEPVSNIRTLVEFMNDPNEIKKYKTFIAIPAIGEIILVKFGDKYQRGRLVDIEEYAKKVMLEVFLVDFGIKATFNMKHCRKIKKEHLHLPFQVVMCTLSNVCMKENLTDTEHEMGSEYLELNILNKKLKAKVIYSPNFLSVHLFTKNGKDVGEELIKAGIVERSEIITSSSTSSLLVD